MCPSAIRLFLKNNHVNSYNNLVLQLSVEKTISVARDNFTGTESNEQLSTFGTKLKGMSVIDTGGLPQEIIFSKEKYYIITTNIDVSDGLAYGKLIHL